MISRWSFLKFLLVLTSLFISQISMANDDIECVAPKSQLIKPILRGEPSYHVTTESYFVIENYGTRDIKKFEIAHGGCGQFYVSFTIPFTNTNPSNEKVLSRSIVLLNTVQSWLDYNFADEVLNRLVQAKREGNFIIGKELTMTAGFDSVVVKVAPNTAQPQILSIIYRSVPRVVE